MRGLPGGRIYQGGNAFSGGRVRALRGVPWPAVQQGYLEIKYRDHSIADVLDLSVHQARDLFDAHPKITQILDTLMDVGLSYIKLGQAATTLSGGEAQRIKLARELARRHTGDTLYILDEPTTGLHFRDVKLLLAVLQRLTDAGNTVIIIEHNLDVIKTADWVMDLGPEGGDGGGTSWRKGLLIRWPAKRGAIPAVSEKMLASGPSSTSDEDVAQCDGGGELKKVSCSA